MWVLGVSKVRRIANDLVWRGCGGLVEFRVVEVSVVRWWVGVVGL